MKKTIILYSLFLFCISLNAQKVGIGTTNPQGKLEIDHNSTLSEPQLHLHENASDYARIKFDNTNGNNFWLLGGFIGPNPKDDLINFTNSESGDLLVLRGNGRLGLGVGTSPKTEFHVGADQNVLFGNDTIGGGFKLMFLPGKDAFRVGELFGGGSVYWDRDSIGQNSFAAGLNAKAKGFVSTSIGYETHANGNYSFASGDNSRAESLRSTALGSYNVGGGSATVWNKDDPIFEIGIGAPSERKNALTVLKDGRHGIMTATPKTELHVGGDSRVLFGSDTLGRGFKFMFLPDLEAFRVGSLNTEGTSTFWDRDSIGEYSFASGLNTRAKGRYATAMGGYTNAVGFGSTAMGRKTEATGVFSFASGESTSAKGYSSTAMGSQTNATSDNAFASGSYTNANGKNSTAMGFGTNAIGFASTALGTRSSADETYTFAAGNDAKAQAHSSISIGTNTKAQSYRSIAIGSYNVGGGNDTTLWNTDDPIFEIGIGQSESIRNNALTVLKDGRHGIMTTTPQANLHVKNDGIAGSRAIVAILESNVSDRPTLLFSDFPTSSISNGMSIEYNGSVTPILKTLSINKIGGGAMATFGNNGNFGIGTTNPAQRIHIASNGIIDQQTIVAVLESDNSNRPILQFSETTVGDLDSGMSIEYDGRGSASSNKMNINKSGGEAAMTIDNGGQVGIGVTSPTFTLHLPDNSVTGKARAFEWTTYSDQRIKSNIKPLPHGLQSILLLRPVSYNQHNSVFANSELILDEEYTNTVGLIAQEVHAVIPDAVTKPQDENEQLWGMDYDKLIPVLIKGMQEQQGQIELLKEEIKKLKNKKENQHDVMIQNSTSLLTKVENNK